MGEKAMILEFNFCVRVVVPSESDGMCEKASSQAYQKIMDKINNRELFENLSEVYEDTECPYDSLND